MSCEDILYHFFDQINEQSDNRENLLYQLDSYYFKVRPKFSQTSVRLLLTGNLSQSVATQYVAQFPVLERNQQSFNRHKPQGLFILMSDHKKSPLVAISAAQILQKLIDYQKNIHAESVVRELVSIEPNFLALFGIESLLKIDGARKSALQIIKAYVERRDHIARIENVIEELFESENVRCEILSKYKNQKADDLSTALRSEQN